MSESDSASEHGGKGDGGGRGGRRDDDQELESKSVQVGGKRFYVDVKQNWHGRYIKLAEVGPVGYQYTRRKSRVLFAMPAAAEFLSRLDEMIAFVATLPAAQKQPPSAQQNGDRPATVADALKTITMECNASSEKRTYTIECRENTRGRFVRVAMNLDGSNRRVIGRSIHSIVQVPDSGLGSLRDAMRPLVEKWNKDLPTDQSYKGGMPDMSSLRVGNKTFYFDYGQTQRGVFMRMSEVKPSWRTSVSVPRSEWENMRDILTEACKIVDKDAGTHQDK